MNSLTDFPLLFLGLGSHMGHLHNSGLFGGVVFKLIILVERIKHTNLDFWLSGQQSSQIDAQSKTIPLREHIAAGWPLRNHFHGYLEGSCFGGGVIRGGEGGKGGNAPPITRHHFDSLSLGGQQKRAK